MKNTEENNNKERKLLTEKKKVDFLKEEGQSTDSEAAKPDGSPEEEVGLLDKSDPAGRRQG
jgi:hypothetical protein